MRKRLASLAVAMATTGMCLGGAGVANAAPDQLMSFSPGPAKSGTWEVQDTYPDAAGCFAKLPSYQAAGYTAICVPHALPGVDAKDKRYDLQALHP